MITDDQQVQQRLEEARLKMVERQLVPRGIRDARVLDAMRLVPRERFVDEGERAHAYDDGPLGIGEGQTISQPYVVALMAEVAQVWPTDRVLEIGTGSGYAAAVLACLAAQVYTIERHESLADLARTRLRQLGHHNVHVEHGDGTLGWPEAAPFDAIIVAAAGRETPRTLLAQLVVGGRLVVPLGPTPERQLLVRFTRQSVADYRREDFGDVRFVPLIGEDAWSLNGASPHAR